jgi:uncharacterized protein YidB (DUF937 family)
VSRAENAGLIAALDASSPDGLRGIVERLRDGGFGDALDAWAAGAEHLPLGPAELLEALGRERIDALGCILGLSTAQTAAELADRLPGLVRASRGSAEPS